MAVGVNTSLNPDLGMFDMTIPSANEIAAEQESIA